MLLIKLQSTNIFREFEDQIIFSFTMVKNTGMGFLNFPQKICFMLNDVVTKSEGDVVFLGFIEFYLTTFFDLREWYHIL